MRAVVLLALLATRAAAVEGAADPFAEIRGVTISCPMAGEEWGSEDMVRTLAVLADLGVNWVAIHPYGGLRNDGTVGQGRIDHLYERPYWLVRAIREAHARGMKILIKPHLAYWGSRFSWRGEIAFDNDTDWQRFFDTYREWIVRVAVLSHHADAFAVGTELDRTTGHEAEWRRIIADVRREMDVPLTYSASWDSYEAVPFWDALDAVAVQAYFPIVDREGPPTDAELAAGWARIASRLEEFGQRQGRHVVLGELGYNRSLTAAVRPWEYRTSPDPAAEDLQVRCLDAALSAVSASDGIAGAFLWKWFPGEFPRGNFLVSTPAMRGVVARHWAVYRAP
jgi:hypothetical protein